MKRPAAWLGGLVLVSALVGCLNPPAPQEQQKAPTVLLAQDFGGATFDPDLWHTEYRWGRTNGNELQYYDAAAVTVADGDLVLTAQRQPKKGKDYTSGLVASYGAFSFTFGRVDVRAKVPSGKGLWPAIWLLTDSDRSDEIDVMELLGDRPDIAYFTLHYDEDGVNTDLGGKYQGTDLSLDYHTYSVDWSPTSIVWFLDGVEQFRTTEHVPQGPLYLIVNLAVGGDWPGNPSPSTVFPAEFRIDSIRVTQPSD